MKTNKRLSSYFIIRNGHYVGIFKFMNNKFYLFKHVRGNETSSCEALLKNIEYFEYKGVVNDQTISFPEISANEQYRIPTRFDMRKKEVHNDLCYFLGRNQTFDIFYNPQSRFYGEEEFRKRVEKYKPKNPFF